MANLASETANIKAYDSHNEGDGMSRVVLVGHAFFYLVTNRVTFSVIRECSMIPRVMFMFRLMFVLNADSEHATHPGSLIILSLCSCHSCS